MAMGSTRITSISTRTPNLHHLRQLQEMLGLSAEEMDDGIDEQVSSSTSGLATF